MTEAVILAAQMDYDFLSVMLEKYGLLGFILAAAFILIFFYLRNESKKVDLEIQKSLETSALSEETKKITGLVEQMKRENTNSLSEAKEILSKISLDIIQKSTSEEQTSANVLELKSSMSELKTSMETMAIRRESAEDDAKNNFSEIKTHLREISRDVIRNK